MTVSAVHQSLEEEEEEEEEEEDIVLSSLQPLSQQGLMLNLIKLVHPTSAAWLAQLAV